MFWKRTRVLFSTSTWWPITTNTFFGPPECAFRHMGKALIHEIKIIKSFLKSCFYFHFLLLYFPKQNQQEQSKMITTLVTIKYDWRKERRRKERWKQTCCLYYILVHREKSHRTTMRFYSLSLPMTPLWSTGSLWSSPQPGHLAESITWRLLEHCRTIRSDAQAFAPHGAAIHWQP